MHSALFPFSVLLSFTSSSGRRPCSSSGRSEKGFAVLKDEKQKNFSVEPTSQREAMPLNYFILVVSDNHWWMHPPVTAPTHHKTQHWVPRSTYTGIKANMGSFGVFTGIKPPFLTSQALFDLGMPAFSGAVNQPLGRVLFCSTGPLLPFELSGHQLVKQSRGTVTKSSSPGQMAERFGQVCAS